MISTGSTVWVYPHGSPEQATEASVELISANKRSIALKLADKPAWARIIETGVALFNDGSGIAMLLTREAIGPWIEVSGGGHYEIEESNPCQNAN